MHHDIEKVILKKEWQGCGSVHGTNDSYHLEVLRIPISIDLYLLSSMNFLALEYLEVGMKFSTLKIFKEVVREYTIHIVREIIWVKNE